VTLPREEIANGLTDELTRVVELIRSLSADEWSAPTRCAGWTVADVAGHVTGQLVDALSGRVEGLGSPEVTEREVAERRGRSAGEIADELEQAVKLGADLLASFDSAAWSGPAPGAPDLTLGEGIEALWTDAWVHADDIRAAVGRPSERTSGLRGSVFHYAALLERDGWGPATLALDGMERIDLSGGGGRTVTGDPLDFVLAATGRRDPSTVGLDETVNVYR
jgi:uncharacterized protein (TIGR03083 family)